MNERLKTFLYDTLPAHGVTVHINWRREAWRPVQGSTPPPMAYHVTFRHEGTPPKSTPLTGVFLDYGRDGYGFYPEAATNTQRADLALITGQPEAALEMAGAA